MLGSKTSKDWIIILPLLYHQYPPFINIEGKNHTLNSYYQPRDEDSDNSRMDDTPIK